MKTAILLSAALMSGCVLKDGLFEDSGSVDPCVADVDEPVTLSTIDGPTDLTLEVGYSCGDVLLYARNSDKTLAMGFESSERLLQDAHEMTAIITRTYVAGADTINFFTLQTGENVGVNYCTDAISISDVETSYTAISGTVEITATPDGSYDPEGYDAEGWVEATFSAVLFEDDSGEQLLLPEMTICGRAGYSIP